MTTKGTFNWVGRIEGKAAIRITSGFNELKANDIIGIATNSAIMTPNNPHPVSDWAAMEGKKVKIIKTIPTAKVIVINTASPTNQMGGKQIIGTWYKAEILKAEGDDILVKSPTINTQPFYTKPLMTWTTKQTAMVILGVAAIAGGIWYYYKHN